MRRHLDMSTAASPMVRLHRPDEAHGEAPPCVGNRAKPVPRLPSVMPFVSRWLLGLLCFALAGNVAGQAVPVPAPAGLVAWWRGEVNTLDEAGGNHGTPVNGEAYLPGKVGQAFSFGAGGDYIEVPDSPELRLSTEVTIEFWAQRPTPDS